MEQRTITAKDVLALLRERYSNGGEWVCASEVQRTTGWSDRRYDFVAMNCWNSNFYKIEVVEIKVSKSDLRRELEEPEKHNVMFDDIDYYSLAAPDKIIDMSIIPPKWGVYAVVDGKLVTKRKPLALHDERDYKVSRSFMFCLMRRLRDDSSTDKSEQELRNAEFQRGYEEGKRWSGKSDYEKLYKGEHEECNNLRRALEALGVRGSWFRATEQLIDEAKDRALTIKKYEKAYNMLCGLKYDLKTFKRLADELGEIMNPLVQIKDEAEKVSEETPSNILYF